MRFWKVPPRPGSLEEVIATAIEYHEEARLFDYVHVMAMASMYSGMQSREAVDSLTETLKNIQQKYFTGVEPKKVDTTEADQFRSLMENFVVQVSDAAVKESLSETREGQVTGLQVFNPNPQGEFIK